MIKAHLLLILILVLAFCLRFININWDQNTHLHPDERFLTMVLMDFKIPDTFSDYLNPARSTLNPTNIYDNSGNKKYSFFVYGTLPLTLTKFASLATDNDTYNGITLVGRFLSVISDILVVILIFKTVRLFEKYKNWDNSVKYWGVFFYSIAVLPIQLSHFFAVDSFLNAFLFASLFFSFKYFFEKNTAFISLSSIFLGFAIASKITAILYLPMLIVFIVSTNLQNVQLSLISNRLITKNFNSKTLALSVLSVFLFTSGVYISLRLTNPYMFENGFLLNPQINNNLIQSLKTLQSWNTKDVWYPPGVQWISKPPVIFSLYNLAVFGLGIPIFILAVFGMIKLLISKKQILINITVLWVLCIFVYQSTQFVKSIRYLIIIYPFMCIYAAFGFVYLHKFVSGYVKITSVLLILIWPLSFISIYLNPHSRITASEWIYENIPPGSSIAWEVWDDPLPLRLSGFSNNYQFIELKPFDYDTADKITEFTRSLDNTDYYILSSNRAWGSIPTVPDKYPYMTKFYSDLFNDKTNFRKIAEFSSYPSLRYIGIPIDFIDELSEEAFTVYDHPKVIIFKKK